MSLQGSFDLVRSWRNPPIMHAAAVEPAGTTGSRGQGIHLLEAHLCIVGYATLVPM